MTAEAQGHIFSLSIEVVAGGLPASIEPPAGPTRVAHTDTTGQTLSFVVRNAQGGFVPIGTRFTASLFGTGFLGTTGGVCDTATNSPPSSVCTGTVATNGVAKVRVFGVGVTGSATLTVSTTSVTASVAITFFGSVASVEVVIADRLPLNDGSAAHSVQAIVLDDRGTEVTGQTVTFSFVETVAAGTSLTNVTVTDGGAEDLTAVGGSADADDGDVNTHFIVGADEQLGTVVTVKAAVGEVSGTASFTVAGEAAFVIVEIAADLLLIRTASLLTVTAVDETGAPARDGATVRVSATFGALAACDPVLNDGVATCTFLAPTTAQTGAIVASVGEGASAASGLLLLTVAVNAPARGVAKTLPAPSAGGITIGISGTTDPAALVAAIRAPPPGSRVSGDHLTLVAGLDEGTPLDVSQILFEFRAVGAGAWALMSGDEEPETTTVTQTVPAVAQPDPAETTAAAPKPTRRSDRTRVREDDRTDDSRKRAAPTPTKRDDENSKKSSKKKRSKKKKTATKKVPPSTFREPGIG